MFLKLLCELISPFCGDFGVELAYSDFRKLQVFLTISSRDRLEQPSGSHVTGMFVVRRSIAASKSNIHNVFS